MAQPLFPLAGSAGAVFVARFSEAFLVLKAGAAGPATSLVMVAMSGVHAFAAYPAGYLSDGIGRRGLLTAGLAALVGSLALPRTA